MGKTSWRRVAVTCWVFLFYWGLKAEFASRALAAARLEVGQQWRVNWFKIARAAGVSCFAKRKRHFSPFWACKQSILIHGSEFLGGMRYYHVLHKFDCERYSVCTFCTCWRSMQTKIPWCGTFLRFVGNTRPWRASFEANICFFFFSRRRFFFFSYVSMSVTVRSRRGWPSRRRRRPYPSLFFRRRKGLWFTISAR